MSQNKKKPYIFVIGNEKGGAGKSTCSMHLISGLLDLGHKVASIDTDVRQKSLTNYINNRQEYNKKNPESQVICSSHYLMAEPSEDNLELRDQGDKTRLEERINQLKDHDYIIIDTPGSHSYLSRLAHSYADTIITPINDSFLDFDVMAKVNPEDMSIIAPSIYSQMVWEQKIKRAARDNGSIDWVVVRNRLSNLDAVNKRNMTKALDLLAKRIGFKIAPGFSERVIFRELFLQGLTLLDLTKTHYSKNLSISHIAARQELRDFLKYCGISAV